MKNFLMIVFLVSVVLGFYGFASGEEVKAKEINVEEKKSLLRPPQFEQPKAGRTVDASFKVALEGIPEGGGCVSVMQEQATILIHRDILEYLKIANPEQAKTDEDNMAALHGRRAEILLNNLMNIKDDHGCSIVEMPFDMDALYLISELLKSGQARVIDNATNKPVEHIYVRYKAFLAGPLAGKGDINFSLAEKSAPFLTILWWIS
jgi:hypothetical protein